MIPQIIRIILGTITFLILHQILRKIKHFKLRNKEMILSLSLSIIFTLILFFIPFENAFLNFSSPQKAFNYYSKNTIKTILEGENSAMIIAGEDDSIQYDIIPKSKNQNKWKIGMGYNVKSIAKLSNNDVLIYIDKYSKYEDYYIYITTINKGICEISDSCNSEFQLITSKTNSYYKNYVAYIKNYNDDYSIFINNKEIKLSDLTSIP